MDGGLVEQMYGDIDHSHSPIAHDDDSVDIYSGLDNTPRKTENAEKCCALSPPGRLRDSMDLYEEIIKEEQQEKEATCNELKTKLDTAQSQVKELLHKLQQSQMQNTSLHTQNICLKKNICALIKTARLEIVRKDEEISRLMQRSGRGGYGTSYPRSQTNIQRNPNARQNSGANHEPIGCSQTQRPRVNCAPGELLLKPHTETRNVTGLHPGPQRMDTSVCTPPSHEISRPVRTDSDVPDRPCDLAVANSNRDSRIPQTLSNKGPVQQASKPYPGNNDTQQKVCEKQAVLSQEITGRKSQCSEGRARQDHSTPVPSKENKVSGRERSEKECKESEKDSVSSGRGRHQHLNPEPHRRSDRGKSPPHQRTQSPPSGSLRHTASGSHSLKIRGRDTEALTKGSGRESRHGHDRGQGRGDRNVPESFGKEKRSSSDQGSLVNKSSASSTHKGERNPTREQCRKEERGREDPSRNRGERKSNRTEKGKEYESSKGKETDKSERDSSRKKGEEKKEKESESRVDSKNCRQTTPPSTLTTAIDGSDPVKERHDRPLAPVQTEVAVKDGVEPEIPVERGAGEKNLPEEGGQNRKLSFMETLNLTLSPVKKPRLSWGGKEQDSSQPEDAGEEGQEDSSLFNLGEEYCVIDEVESSREMDEVFEVPAAASSGIGDAEKALGPLPEPDFKNTEMEHAPDKGDGEIQEARVSDEQAKCDAERDQNVVLQTADCKLPTAFVDQDTTAATSQKPINDEDHTSISEADNADVVKTTLPTEFPNRAAENHTGVFVVQNILTTDSDPPVCGSKSENDNSLLCETPSIERVETVAHGPAVLCVENCSADNSDCVQSECQSTPLTVLPEAVLQDASTSVVMDTHPKGATTSEVCDVSTNAVSSTVSVEVASQSCDYADVASDVMETVVISSTEPEKDDDEPVTSHDQSKAQSVEVVSSTIRGESIQPEPGSSGSVQMAQDCCSSEPDSTEDEERNAEPSSSVPFTHDEDSMMLTLQNIRHIPEAISPLTSPVRPVKKSLPHCSGKAQHVKSLAKDFSAVTGAKRIDVNKENEKPHCSSTEISQRDSAQTPSSSSSSSENDNELEEGEIVSESEEDPPPVAPSPPLRKTHSTTTIKKQPSPRSPRLAKKQAQKTPVVPQGLSGSRRKTTPNNSPTSNKRLKTVLQFVPKTNPSTVPEVMDMLKSIRTELRRKYMRLQKSFPKKSFYNIIDICLFSFTDFVNNVSFSECCSLESILKPKLNNIISTTMKKISNNGIVNRIFEQQSPSLKKKLWTFVEDQFDFLFREIQATFASLGKSPESRAKHLSMTKNTVERSKEKKELRKIPAKPPAIAVPTPKRKAEEVDSVDMTGVKGKKANPPTVPHRTGLGSRGKNLRMNKEGEDQPSEARELPPLRSPSKAAVTPPKNSSGEKPAACVRRLSHNGSIQDKSDFEILTEQQASSLTFNLVTDSQMGEIFKCLLQGSDLLENSVSVGDAHSWPVGTPRKDAAGWESYVVVTTPNKTATSPSKVITTWSAVSPCKFLSPNSKIRVPLNPALLDESCLLEVPSSSLPLCRATPSSAVPSQRTYSILAEDLAVSLSIPSPLKSDSHLSFLHPESGEPMSAPESVISAHFSEDALMDGEDATEQDIHLALDSDNSSAGSNGCRTWEEVASPVFQFKPHLPMQAVVMEKSNDHFIVKIRHTSSSFAASPGQNSTAAETGSERVMEHVDAAHSSSGTSPDGDRSGQSPNPAFCDDSGTHLPVKEALQASEGGTLEQAASLHDASGAHSDGEPAKAPSNSETGESAALSEELVVVAGESTAAEKDIRIGKKRKKHHAEPRAKRAKTEHAQERLSKQRRKKRSKCAKDKGVRTPKRKRSKSTGPPLSPNSLSAKNIIRKKGEVVVTWTRDEDRYILVELKTKGASPETFSALSAKINKPPDLIGKRFCQLMKLFKKTERMES